jgi:hypothetical protein
MRYAAARWQAPFRSALVAGGNPTARIGTVP